jgi:hypothetical protein
MSINVLSTYRLKSSQITVFWLTLHGITTIKALKYHTLFSILLRFCPTQNAHAQNATSVTMEESYCKKVYNAGVYGEVGRWPLYIACFVKVIKLWCKTIRTVNMIIKKGYEQSVIDCEHRYKC